MTWMVTQLWTVEKITDKAKFSQQKFAVKQMSALYRLCSSNQVSKFKQAVIAKWQTQAFEAEKSAFHLAMLLFLKAS